MITLVPETGVGLNNANSYASVAEANGYLETEAASSWTPLTDQQKSALLVKATRLLDTYTSPTGNRSTSSQALDWPRTDVLCPATQQTYNAAELPTTLKLCTALLALWLSQGNDVDQSTPSQNVDSVNVEGLAISFTGGSTNASPLPKVILDILAKWGITNRRGYATIDRV